MIQNKHLLRDIYLLVKIKCDNDECSINQWLVNEDYAFEYHGGTKKDFKKEIEEEKENKR